MVPLERFTNLYQLSKTLRFELIPIGKTLEFIETNGLLLQDEHRAESYKEVKRIIDEFHKKFIEDSLSKLQLKMQKDENNDSLEEFFFYYMLPQKDEMKKMFLPKVQKKLRKQIVSSFTSNSGFSRLNKKELIKEDLLDFAKPEEQELIREFKNFTTYFDGFHKNRGNMYSDEEKSSTIAYRLIHENLPRFIDNIRAFEKIRTAPVKERFPQILKELEEVIQVPTIEEMFQLGYFNNTLTQTGIDCYNTLIGGFTSFDGKQKIQGLNEYINLYNQNVKSKKDKQLPKLKLLYKQILSDRVTASFIPEQYQSDQEVLDSILEFYRTIQETISPKGTGRSYTLKELLQNLQNYNVDAIYLKNDKTLTSISKKLFGDWPVITKAVEKDIMQNNLRKTKESESEYQERVEGLIKKSDSFSIAYLNHCITLLELEETNKIESYFSTLGKTEENGEDIFQKIERCYQNVESLLNMPYPEDRNLSQQKKDVENIKSFLDTLKSLQHFIKPLLGNVNEAEKDNNFYGEFIPMWDVLNEYLTPLYNKVRNYVTRKPYSIEKFKLNFENSHFLSGWSPDYETKAGLLFKKDGCYYLGVNNKKLTEGEKSRLKASEGNAKRIVLDFQKPDNKNIPRLFIRSKGDSFAPAVALYNLPIQDVIEIYDSGKFKTEYREVNESDYLMSLHKLIDYFKNGFSKHKSYKHYHFAWRPTKEYKDIAEFYRDVEISCYQIKEECINWDILLEMVDEGKLYLFKIYNKDFSPYSKGTPNLHTLYWEMLFDPENLKNVIYKLNGQAEVFFRRSSIKNKNIIVHKANESIKNKNIQNKKCESSFEYNLIKDRRFTIDKFQFHVPITMNFKAKGTNTVNPAVNQFIKENHNDIHVIGIDRGERHLLYLTLVDSQGNIKKQFSLNEIVNKYKKDDEYCEVKTNYHHLLDKKEGDRDEARKNWQTMETIKELKEGYISQVVHVITSLMTEYNAIVVLEDLNLGFKRSRQKVEKSVYQKFEKMLIEKLNYLADKQKNATEIGGLLNALQLTDRFTSFKDLNKQSGFLFYVPAWNTSKMDPVTGFVNLFDTRYENIDKTKEFFRKFDAIRFNAEKNYFEFSFDYKQFTPKADGAKTDWTVCTYGDRIENFRNPEQSNEWDSREFDLTSEMKALFEKYRIDLQSDLKEAIEKQSDKAFFYHDGKDKKSKQKGLLQLFRLIVQMRNSKIKSEEDYLISPVANKAGAFFDSRCVKNDSLPKNADANGAYNIARKGLWVIEQICKAENLGKVKLAISNKEWMQFAQK